MRKQLEVEHAMGLYITTTLCRHPLVDSHLCIAKEQVRYEGEEITMNFKDSKDAADIIVNIYGGAKGRQRNLWRADHLLRQQALVTAQVRRLYASEAFFAGLMARVVFLHALTYLHSL
jgi:hypothetical protein